MNSIYRISTILLGTSLACSLLASPRVFDFADPKGVNNIVFLTDAPLESINGTASGITGKVHFDRTDPAATQGEIVIQTSSMHVSNPVMREHLHGNRWMDVASYPEMKFVVERLEAVESDANRIRAHAVGTMTVRGVTQPMRIPVQLTYLEGRLRERGGIDADGDILVVRSDFFILRSDFGINAGQNLDRVANEIEIRLSLAGLSPNS